MATQERKDQGEVAAHSPVGLPTCLHQKNPDLPCPKNSQKSQTVVLQHVHIK